MLVRACGRDVGSEVGVPQHDDAPEVWGQLPQIKSGDRWTVARVGLTYRLVRGVSVCNVQN